MGSAGEQPISNKLYGCTIIKEDTLWFPPFVIIGILNG